MWRRIAWYGVPIAFWAVHSQGGCHGAILADPRGNGRLWTLPRGMASTGGTPGPGPSIIVFLQPGTEHSISVMVLLISAASIGSMCIALIISLDNFIA